MLDAQFKRLEAKIRKSVVAVAVDVAQNAVLSVSMPVTEAQTMSPFGSPVDTGFYQKSHTVSLNQADNRTGLNEDHNSELADITRAMNLGDSIIIANAVEYAEKLDRRPSPLRKTRGKMYENAAKLAIQITNSEKEEIGRAIARAFAPVRIHKIEVKL